MAGIVNTIVEVGTLGMVDDVMGTEAATDAANKAAQIQGDAALAGIDEQRRQFDVTQESLQPQIEAGNLALSQQRALTGLDGNEAQQTAFDQFNQSPGQQFMQERAQKALIRNSAAIGGLGGGNIRSALVQQGVGFAQQDYNNQFNRLAGIAGQGQQATTNVGQFGQATANNIQQGLTNQAEARASGVLGAAQVNAQANQQLFNLAATAAGAAL